MSASIIASVKHLIEKELESCVHSKFQNTNISHNHPPLRRIVENCPYCQKFGNIFCTS
jgi:hypothetical protein